MRRIPKIANLERIIFSAGLIWLCLVTQGAESSQKNIFKVMDVFPGGKVELCGVDDMDGDGKDEIITVWRKGSYPDTELVLSVFRIARDSDGVLSAHELFSAPLDKKYVLIDTGFPAHGEKRDFFALAHDGVWALHIRDKKVSPQKIIATQTLVGLAEVGGLSLFDFVRDWNGDGADEVLVPEKSGMSLWSNDSSEYKRKAFFDVEPKYFYRSSHGSLAFEPKYSFRGIYWVPQVLNLDFNGDGRMDILFLWQDELDVFYLGSGGGYQEQEPGHFYFHDITQEERDSRNTYVTYFVTDIDGNGLPDLIKNKFKGALTSLTSEMEITFRENPLTLDGKKIALKPDGRIGQGGLVKDINGDGYKDLVMVSSSFGILAIVKALLKKKIDIKFSFFLFKPGSYFEKKPDFRRILSFGFDLKNARIEGLLPTLDVDFDGDKLPDVFYATGAKEVRVIFNRGKRHYSLSRVRKLEVDVSKKVVIADLDGDKKSDILFYYPGGKLKDRVRVLYNSRSF